MTDLLHSRYRLDEVIGQGAMGVVWRAHDEVLDRPIAVKELRPAPGVDPGEALDRFLVEARATARLSHPNIVGVHDVFSDGARVLIVMELVLGPTLDEVVAASGAQSPEVVRAVMAQVAQALAAAHRGGVIHRDLKPENIFWSEGRAVVADFGLARIGAGRGTVEGTVMGTPGYMAPEQIKGSPTGPATDVFGWGAVAYHLAAGRAPFGEQSQTDPSAMAYRIVHQDPESLSLPGDPALAALITQALSKEPADRPGDGMALAAMLARFFPSCSSTQPHARYADDTDLLCELAHEHLTAATRRRLRLAIEIGASSLRSAEVPLLVTDAVWLGEFGLMMVTSERLVFIREHPSFRIYWNTNSIREVRMYRDGARGTFRNGGKGALHEIYSLEILTRTSRLAFQWVGNKEWADMVGNAICKLQKSPSASVNEGWSDYRPVFLTDSTALFACRLCLVSYMRQPLALVCDECGGQLLARSVGIS